MRPIIRGVEAMRAGASMTAENDQYFRPVRDFCQRAVVTCAADAPLLEVVRTMREKAISCVIVVADGMPRAILTDRDLRNKVVAEDRSPATLTVADVMNAPLAVIGEDDVLYEALYRLSRQKIHRLVVVDGVLAGVHGAQDRARAFGIGIGHPHAGAADRQPPFPVRDRQVLVAHVRVDALGLQQAAGDLRFDRIEVAGDGGEHARVRGAHAPVQATGYASARTPR